MIFICTAFFIAGLASAQTDSTQHQGFGKGKTGMQHRHGGQMAQKLNLTDDQKAQLKTVNEGYRKQLSDLKADTALSADERKTQFSALQKSHREEMNKIFTDDQKRMLADGRSKMQGRGHMGGGRGAKGGANFDKMKQELNLTDDQAAKLKTQREQLRTQMKTINSDSTLTADQKKEKAKQLFSQQKEQLKTILTPEQLAKMQSMRKGRMNYRRHGDNSQVK